MKLAGSRISCSALALFFCLSCGSAPRPADDDTAEWLAPGTRAYGSSDAILGALGRKRRIGRGEAFFERVTIPAWKSLEVYNAGAFTVTQEHIARLKELGLSLEALAAVNAKLGRQTTSSFKLVLLQIRDQQKLATEIDKALTEDVGLSRVLSQPSMRIITSVGVVFDQEATSKLEAAVGAKATLTKVANQDVELKIDTEFQKNYKVQISDGTIVAYQFARLCWAADGSLFTLIRDVQRKDVCPTGSSEVLGVGSRTKAPPTPAELEIDADPVNIDFPTKNSGQTGGCHCENGDITFPGDLRGKAGEPLTFRYDGSEVCHGQGFRNFEGAISWTGTLSTPMANRNDNATFPGIAGTLKVTFSQPGSYNVRATFSLDCVDIKCSERCSAQGNTTLVIR